MIHFNNKRIKLLNSLTNPKEAAYSDREHPLLSQLVDYSFERVGGGRVLKYARWNKERINNLSEIKFNEIIEHLRILIRIREQYSNMSIFDFLTMGLK